MSSINFRKFCSLFLEIFSATFFLSFHTGILSPWYVTLIISNSPPNCHSIYFSIFLFCSSVYTFYLSAFNFTYSPLFSPLGGYDCPSICLHKTKNSQFHDCPFFFSIQLLCWDLLFHLLQTFCFLSLKVF